MPLPGTLSNSSSVKGSVGFELSTEFRSLDRCYPTSLSSESFPFWIIFEGIVQDVGGVEESGSSVALMILSCERKREIVSKRSGWTIG